METIGNPFNYVPPHRILYRGALLLGAFTVVYISNSNEGIEWARPFASVNEKVHHRSKKLPCSEDYDEDSRLLTPGCVPKVCGRYVSDTLLLPSEKDALLVLSMKGFALDKRIGNGRSMSAAIRIFDLLSGLNGVKNIFNDSEMQFIRSMKNKVLDTIQTIFGLSSKPFLMKPTHFARFSAEDPRKLGQVYWKLHVDKHKNPAIHYRGIIYLTEYGKEFHGGRFIYGDSNELGYNRTIEPRRGRVSIYTAGAENDHLVERVKFGHRHALIMSFTCNVSAALLDLPPEFIRYVFD